MPVIMEWTGHSCFQAMKPDVKIVDSAKADNMALFDRDGSGEGATRKATRKRLRRGRPTRKMTHGRRERMVTAMLFQAHIWHSIAKIPLLLPECGTTET